MTPLIFAVSGEENIIKKVDGKSDVRRHLEEMGFVVGGNVTLISENNGNVIVGVKGCRVAISRETALKIMV